MNGERASETGTDPQRSSGRRWRARSLLPTQPGPKCSRRPARREGQAARSRGLCRPVPGVLNLGEPGPASPPPPMHCACTPPPGGTQVWQERMTSGPSKGGPPSLLPAQKRNVAKLGGAAYRRGILGWAPSLAGYRGLLSWGHPRMVRRKEGQQALPGLRGTAQVGSQSGATECESLSTNSAPFSGPQQPPPRKPLVDPAGFYALLLQVPRGSGRLHGIRIQELQSWKDEGPLLNPVLAFPGGEADARTRGGSHATGGRSGSGPGWQWWISICQPRMPSGSLLPPLS